MLVFFSNDVNSGVFCLHPYNIFYTRIVDPLYQKNVNNSKIKILQKPILITEISNQFPTEKYPSKIFQCAHEGQAQSDP